LVGGIKTEFKEITPLSKTAMVNEKGQVQQQQDISKEISVFISKGDKKIEIIGKDRTYS
jgi:hypothetical protein